MKIVSVFNKIVKIHGYSLVELVATFIGVYTEKHNFCRILCVQIPGFENIISAFFVYSVLNGENNFQNFIHIPCI